MQSFHRTKSSHVYAFCLSAFIFSFSLIGPDLEFSSWLHDVMRPYDFWLQVFTWMGDGRVIIPICLVGAVFLWFFKKAKSRIPFAGIVAFLLSGAFVQILKPIFGRPRPYALGDIRYEDLALDKLHWFSFNKDFASYPSGHATAIFALAWVIASQVKSKQWRIFVFLTGVVVAFTRVALAKHYVADTLAGAALGVFSAELVIGPVSRWFKRIQNSKVQTVVKPQNKVS